MDDDRWPKPGVASLQNVSRLLLKIKETFWKKKKKGEESKQIYSGIYIYIYKYPPPFGGEFHLYLESEFTCGRKQTTSRCLVFDTSSDTSL